jgi:serine/threonine-protein kinase
VTGPLDERASTMPDRVGPYRLEAIIDAGGFGAVYRATHTERGTPAAIKIVHPELACKPSIVSRFEREVEAIQRVRHPNVVAVLDHGLLSDGRPYLIMELLSGTDLKAHLDARGRLSIEEMLEIFEPLCAAVAAAHAHAIVHRDIKASNVFLSEGAGGPRVVLLDFGVAKLLDDDGPGLTTSRQLVGTLSCMAPEQIFAGPVDERTDVYALGVLAYRMLTGEMPYTGSSLLALQQMHLYAVPRPPSSRAPVSPAFDGVLLRALEKDPAKRPPSAAAFLDALRAAAQGAVARERRTLVVFVEIRVDPAALDAPGEHLLADLESIVPAAVDALAPLGLDVAQETGTSVLLARELPPEAAADTALRRDVLGAVAALHAQLRDRPGRDEAVEVRLYVHVGALALDLAGRAVGGALLQLDSWVLERPAAAEPLVLVSRAAISGLSAPVLPLDPTHEEWTELHVRRDE